MKANTPSPAPMQGRTDQSEQIEAPFRWSATENVTTDPVMETATTIEYLGCAAALRSYRAKRGQAAQRKSAIAGRKRKEMRSAERP